jgi:chlorobactene glucosyltransferase
MAGMGMLEISEQVVGEARVVHCSRAPAPPDVQKALSVSGPRGSARLAEMRPMTFYLAAGLIVYGTSIALFYTFVWFRIFTTLSRAPRVRDGLSEPVPADGWPLVSIVVPAHNEERVIAACAASLLASEYPALEVVIVLDRCTDRTLELLRPFAGRDPRLRIVENTACPPDWAGKCNAARLGAEAARGRYLLFTDADVQFDTALVQAALGLVRRERLGLLSLLPRVVSVAWYERVMQPIAAMTLMQMYPIDKVNRAYRRRPFANGQFLMFDRNVYERIGGHAATKDDLLEDIAFARLVEASGARGGLALATDMLEVHMYGSLAAMQAGWKRIFIEASRRRVRSLRRKAMVICALGICTPLAQVGALAAGAAVGGATLIWAVTAVAWGIGAQAAALAMVYRTCRVPVRDVVWSPAGAVLVALTLWRGANDLAERRPVRWGGREYRLMPED